MSRPFAPSIGCAGRGSFKPHAGVRNQGLEPETETRGLFSAVMHRATRTQLQIGQRYAQVGIPSTIWQVVLVYQDALGVEHAALTNDTRNRDKKTLSAVALQDRSRFRLI
jgi:hypothetical protein